MAIRKHLHELLKEDQEPFHLKSYIADRKCQVKRPNAHKPTSLHFKNHHPIVPSSPVAASKLSFCKHSCFLSFHPSPEITKSPFPSFLSPTRNQNGPVFLHIPARTAALLLEAALKIQKQQSSSHSKSKTQIKNLGLGLFSSILKKLKDRKRSRGNEIRYREEKFSRNSEVKREEISEKRRTSGVGLSGSLGDGWHSSVGWSENDEERRCLDVETCTSSFTSENSEEIDLVAQEGENNGLNCCEKSFCSSPFSPFRFSLQRCLSSGGSTPIFSPPAASPSRRKEQKKENFGSEEEEGEQCSPVSVLDPPFENEDDEHESLEEEDYDVECSFAIVQRAKEKLLYQLDRFQKLAELDPVELEKRMQDDEDNEAGTQEDVEMCTCEELSSAHTRYRIDSYVKEVLSKSDLLHHAKVRRDMERLVSDLLAEEEEEKKWLQKGEVLVGRVCRKLECWKEVESNTIDMMAEMDLRNELMSWNSFEGQREQTGMEIEVAVLGLLVEELTYELLLAPV